MALSGSPEGDHSILPEIVDIPYSGVIFDATDPRAAELTKEDRIRLYYARELADGNIYGPRYRTSDNDGENEDPTKDILVADPLSDPQIPILASMIRLTRDNTKNRG
jgi:hypothetical protein